MILINTICANFLKVMKELQKYVTYCMFIESNGAAKDPILIMLFKCWSLFSIAFGLLEQFNINNFYIQYWFYSLYSQNNYNDGRIRKIIYFLSFCAVWTKSLFELAIVSLSHPFQGYVFSMNQCFELIWSAQLSFRHF